MNDTAPAPTTLQISQKTAWLRWSVARFIAHSRLPQASAFIPTIGYAILWSQQFSELLKSDGPLGGSLLPPILRLHLLWWGAVLMTLGWGLYLWKCPNEIKRAGSPEDYVQEKFRVPSIDSVVIAQNRARKQVEGYHPQEAGTLVLGGLKPIDVNRAINYLQNQLDHAYEGSWSHFTILLFRLEYLLIDQQRPFARRLCVTLLGSGALLFLIPSLEVSARVVRSAFESLWGLLNT